MQSPRSYIFNEKLAAGLLLLFFQICLAGAVVLQPGSVLTNSDFEALPLWQVACWISPFVAFCAAIATIFLKPIITLTTANAYRPKSAIDDARRGHALEFRRNRRAF